MNREQEKIFDYLKQHAVGINNAIHIAQIAEVLGIPPKGTNNDDVRGWIKEMVVTHQLPIGTCNRGAYLITTEKERELAAQFLERNSTANVIRNINLYRP